MAELALRITEPGAAPREVPLTAGLTLGRGADNDCVLDDAKASGRHAHVVEQDDGSLAVEDLGSSNNTKISGGPALTQGERHKLVPGVALQMGDTKVVVVVKEGKGESARDVDKTVMAKVGDGFGRTVGADDSDEEGMSGLAELAAFKTARPRLVLCNEAIRRIVDLDKVVFVIGRATEGVNCTIEHPAVSGNHAQVIFARRRFFLEDQGSRNGTYVDGEMLAPNSRVELKPESHVRIGSIDALFVVDTDPEGRKPDPKRFRAALDLLTREGRITKLQREKAEQEARDRDQHPGVMLLENGYIKVEQWVDALKRGDIFVLTQAAAGGGGGGTKGLLVIIVVLLAAFVVILLVKPGLIGLGG